MKLQSSLINLMVTIILVGCGENSSSSNSLSPSNDSSNHSRKEITDITNQRLIEGIQANTGEVYRLRQENTGYSMKSLTIANSATKKCSLKIIDIKADWHEEMESRYQYGRVFNIQSSDEESIPYKNGAYLFPYSNDDHRFFIYFASGGSSSNFVDFTLNCENKKNTALETDETMNEEHENSIAKKALIGSWLAEKCYSYYHFASSDADSFEGSVSYSKTFFENGTAFLDSTYFKNKTCNDSDIYSRVRGVSKYRIGKKTFSNNGQIAFELDRKIIKGIDLLTGKEQYFDAGWEYRMVQFNEDKTKIKTATTGKNSGETPETRLNSFEENDYFYKINDTNIKVHNENSNTSLNLNNGLVAHYEFEGNALDSSGEANHGIEYGEVSYVDGVIGQAGSFNGETDYIKVENHLVHNQSMSQTLSCWIYIDEYQERRWGSRFIGMAGTGKNRFYLAIKNKKLHADYGVDNNDGGYRGGDTTTVSLYRWHLATFVSNGDKGEKIVYLDGKQVYSFNGGNNHNQINALYYIGGMEGYLRETKYKGLIDDLRIYDRALNQTEIEELYKMGEKNIDSDDTKEIVTDNISKL